MKERVAVANAKADLLAVLTPDQRKGFSNLTAYSQVDRAYQVACGQSDAGAVNQLMQTLPGSSLDPMPPDILRTTLKPLSAELTARLCAPVYIDCEKLTTDQEDISQVNMRCQELLLQTLNNQKLMTADYGYDTNEILYDLLRVNYPDFQLEQVW